MPSQQPNNQARQLPSLTSASEHHELSFSAMNRWGNCPGSRWLIPQCPPQPQSSYASWGVLCHKVAAVMLQEELGTITDTVSWTPEETEAITDEMVSVARTYVDYVLLRVADYGLTESYVSVEKRVHINGVGPEYPMFGTLDCSLLVPCNRLIIIDLKTGAGKLVSPALNDQLLSYALGKWCELEPGTQEQIDVIELVIVQPRHPSGGVSTWHATKEDLAAFATSFPLKVMATRDPNAPLVPGSWCEENFCPARAVCPALTARIRDRAGEVFSNHPMPEEPTNEQLARWFDMLPLIESKIEAVKEMMLRKAEHGSVFPGLKLVEKRSNRKWGDEQEAMAVLERDLGDDAYESVLLSPSKAEKAYRKAGRNLDLMPETVKPFNGYTLVPESDRRPEVNPLLRLTEEPIDVQ